MNSNTIIKRIEITCETIIDATNNMPQNDYTNGQKQTAKYILQLIQISQKDQTTTKEETWLNKTFNEIKKKQQQRGMFNDDTHHTQRK